jgi:prepilin-type N-terminal cleavage/methylation domain-containing protein
MKAQASNQRPLARLLPFLLADERGVSLVEVLVGLAIAAGIAAFIGTAIWQFFTVTRWGNNQMLATSDHQTAILWLGRDSTEAESFTPGSGSEYGTFAWPDGDPAFRYRYDAAEGALVRDELAGGVVQSSQTVARYIASQSDVSFAGNGQLVTVDILSTRAGQTFETELQLHMRVP